MNTMSQSLPDTYVIYTDGACSGNPGPGGWGVVLRCGDQEQELMGGDAHTTNNRMEMMAAVEALKTTPLKAQVDLYTDSSYLRDGMTSWMAKWKANGWMTSQKDPVKNQDLWMQLDLLCAERHVRWHWVRGHNGHPENERADFLARNAILQEMMKSPLTLPVNDES